MQLRESVRKIDLTGSRRMVRLVTAWMIAAFAVVGALGYVMPVYGMSFFDVGGWFPLAILVLVFGLAVGLRNRQLGSGIFTGLHAIVGSILAVGPLLFANHVHGAGELFALGVLGLFLVGGAMILSEPILYILERRHRRATVLTRLPIARAFA